MKLLLGVEEYLNCRIIHIIASDDLVASGDVPWDACHAIKVCHSHFHCHIAHISWFLSDDHIDCAGFEHFNGGLGGVESDDLDFTAQALVGDDLTSALGGEDVGAEDASQVRALFEA